MQNIVHESRCRPVACHFQLELSLQNFQPHRKSEAELSNGLREKKIALPSILVNVQYDFASGKWIDGETKTEIPKTLWISNQFIFPRQPFTPLHLTGKRYS